MTPPITLVTADKVPTLPVLACIVLTMLAEPAFKSVLAVMTPPITLVTADKVPTLPVLACIVLAMLAEPAFKSVLAVMTPPIKPVLATILSACSLEVNDSVVVTWLLEFSDITYALLDV